ncbi:hypothetical protein JG688_00008546, partial [Phytophthora aleatoria]
KLSLSQKSSQSSRLSQHSSTFSSPSSPGWDDADELLLGPPIRATKTRDEVKETEVNARADANPDIKIEDLLKDISIDAHSGMHYTLLYKRIDVLKWFRDEGGAQFPSIALLARIHLGKILSSAFQERVFSTGGIVMRPLRTRTDIRRVERQLVLRHNREEVVKMKQDGCKVTDSFIEK